MRNFYGVSIRDTAIYQIWPYVCSLARLLLWMVNDQAIDTLSTKQFWSLKQETET